MLNTTYKIGDRVQLVTNGGYPRFAPGMLGTVKEINFSCVGVKVDGSEHDALNFYEREIRPYVPVPSFRWEAPKEAFVFTDRLNDTVKFEGNYTTENAYVSINDGVQVAITPEGKQELVEWLGAAPVAPVEQSDTGVFYMVRERKDKPGKMRICFNSELSLGGDKYGKVFTSRKACQARVRFMNAGEHAARNTYFMLTQETV